MLRKIILLIAIMAVAMAAATSTATAQVEVHNAGDFEMEGELSLTIGEHSPIGFLPGIECQNHWTGSITHEGHVSLTDVNIDPHPGDVGNCESMNDCDNAGWEGQLADSAGEEILQMHMCWILTGNPLSGVPFRIRCTIGSGGATAHCDSPLLHEPTGAPHGRVEIIGEWNISPAVEIEHLAD